MINVNSHSAASIVGLSVLTDVEEHAGGQKHGEKA
jgi:hypothetical protein